MQECLSQKLNNKRSKISINIQIYHFFIAINRGDDCGWKKRRQRQAKLQRNAVEERDAVCWWAWLNRSRQQVTGERWFLWALKNVLFYVEIFFSWKSPEGAKQAKKHASNERENPMRDFIISHILEIPFHLTW